MAGKKVPITASSRLGNKSSRIGIAASGHALK
jgi:hypothetical protein